ncbi:hypothetical protein FH972_010866 [Carpinus fangiana]|uniref:Uncharacterized protein n=1 Tax=Carpinus fangiana TaxID=176857 RepID=A0A660KRB7_9ROSI|nr:hypothetical protein FH972_010866 [Carpinus fangiana]
MCASFNFVSATVWASAVSTLAKFGTMFNSLKTLMHRSGQKWDKLYIFLKLKTPHPIQRNMLTIFLSHGASLPGSLLVYTGRKVHNMGDVDPDHLWVEHRRRYGRYVRYRNRTLSTYDSLKDLIWRDGDHV